MAEAEIDPIDNCPPKELLNAMLILNKKKLDRSNIGTKVLWFLYRNPDDFFSVEILENNIPGAHLHFAWYCKKVTEILGYEPFGEFPLAVRKIGDGNKVFLKLKPNVLSAMELSNARKS